MSASRPGRVLPPGKGSPLPIEHEAGWAPEPVWTKRLYKKSFRPCRESNLDCPVFQSVVRHYTAWATPASKKGRATKIKITPLRMCKFLLSCSLQWCEFNFCLAITFLPIKLSKRSLHLITLYLISQTEGRWAEIFKTGYELRVWGSIPSKGSTVFLHHVETCSRAYEVFNTTRTGSRNAVSETDWA
jgi:hypothetical protein